MKRLFRAAGILFLAYTACSSREEAAYVVGASSSGVPFTFLDVESSSPRGIMVDIVRAVAVGIL